MAFASPWVARAAMMLRTCCPSLPGCSASSDRLEVCEPGHAGVLGRLGALHGSYPRDPSACLEANAKLLRLSSDRTRYLPAQPLCHAARHGDRRDRLSAQPSRRQQGIRCLRFDCERPSTLEVVWLLELLRSVDVVTLSQPRIRDIRHIGRSSGDRFVSFRRGRATAVAATDNSIWAMSTPVVLSTTSLWHRTCCRKPTVVSNAIHNRGQAMRGRT